MKTKTILLFAFSVAVSANTFSSVHSGREANFHLLPFLSTGISTTLAGWNYFFPGDPQKKRTNTGKRIREIIFELAEARGKLKNQEHIEALEAELSELLESDPRGNIEEPTENVQTSIESEHYKHRGFVPGILMAPTDSSKSSNSDSPQPSKETPGVSSGPTSSEDSDDSETGTQFRIHIPKTPFKKRPCHKDSSDDDLSGEFLGPLVTQACAASTPVFGTPAGTPVMQGPPILTLANRVRRAFETAAAIGRNSNLMQNPCMLLEKHWPEACEPNHPFVSGRDGSTALSEWKKSNHPYSFHEHPAEFSSVIYLTDAERNTHRVHIQNIEGQNARLLLNNQPLLNAKLIFVMGPYGRLYVARDIEGQFHHSSFFSGGAVLWAGELTTNDEGEIVGLSNESGHYQPGREQTLNGLRELARRGVDLNKIKLKEFCPNDTSFEGITYNAGEYLRYFSSLFIQDSY